MSNFAAGVGWLGAAAIANQQFRKDSENSRSLSGKNNDRLLSKSFRSVFAFLLTQRFAASPGITQDIRLGKDMSRKRGQIVFG